jgi:hypothetical protein
MQMDFRPSDSGPKRSGQLGTMWNVLCGHERRIGKLEDFSGLASGAEAPGDPGDLTLYLANGLT